MTLVAEIADTYIGLRTAQEQLRISRENLKLQRDIAGLVAEKYRAGLTDDIALNQANYAVETTQSLIPGIGAAGLGFLQCVGDSDRCAARAFVGKTGTGSRQSGFPVF